MLALHRKIHECLKDRPMTNEEIMKLMPEEKPNSIKAVITLHPELFVRITTGVVGRRNRDEHLVKFYEQAKTKIPTITQIIKCFLATGPKTLKEIYKEFPDIKEKSIQQKLRNDGEIQEADGTYSIKS